MKRFISYFDYLGYKEFILNNDSDYVRGRIDQLLRDIEHSLGLGRSLEPVGINIYADLSQSKINCLNISDTVIFWTNDDSTESAQELLEVTYRFSLTEILYNVPTRGCMVFDDFGLVNGSQNNEVGGTYNVNMLFGIGLVKAHIKAENQNWAGFVIDESVIQQLAQTVDIDQTLEPFAIRYMVPYKQVPDEHHPEYALRLSDYLLNDTSFNNTVDLIRSGFSKDNKDPNKPRVKEILDNTIAYLSTFKE